MREYLARLPGTSPSGFVRFSRFHLIMLMLFLVALLAGCGQVEPDFSERPGDKKDPNVLKATPYPIKDDLPATEFWLAKAVEILRPGLPLNMDDPIDRWLEQPRLKTIKELMNEDRFTEMVLDFNLFFLRNKIEDVREDPGGPFAGPEGEVRYTSAVYNFPSAVDSAIQTARGGDYLSLFDYSVPVYSSPLRGFQFVQFSEDDDLFKGISQEKWDSMTDPEKRRMIGSFFLNQVQEFVKDTRHRAENGTSLSREDFCDNGQDAFNPFGRFFQMGIDGSLINRLIYVLGEALGYCQAPETDPANRVAMLERTYKKYEHIIHAILKLEPENYKLTKLEDLKKIDLRTVGLSPIYSHYSIDFWSNYENSSTNMNRKRAAYILSTYFCDDLTPIAFVEPDTHSQGRHGSEATCLACHYKLDPMAGFFRSHGLFGFDFNGAPEITFDDMATTSYAEYSKQWRFENHPTKWNVGFIRSQTDLNRNIYGKTMEDLFRIIRESPEPKECLVDRLSQYVLGDETNIDSGYLAFVTDQFFVDTQSNSSEAFKRALTRFLISKTFSKEDPEATTCYDYAPGVNPQNRPPCEIAYTFSKHCVACHSSKDSPGGLDLGRWKARGGKGFPHFDQNGNAISYEESLERIRDRISTSDPAIQMPLGRHMPPHDREKMFLWLNQELSRGENS